jgi:hypothetical protein
VPKDCPAGAAWRRQGLRGHTSTVTAHDQPSALPTNCNS